MYGRESLQRRMIALNIEKSEYRAERDHVRRERIMSTNTMRGQVAVVGVGETDYYKRGQAPDAEFMLALKAILKACENAGIDPKEIDGFASYSNDRSDPSKLAAALGCKELRFSNMQWEW